MVKVRLDVVRTGLGVSDSEFDKIRQTVQEEVQREGLGTKSLGTNRMRKILYELVEKIRTKAEQHITSTDRTRVEEALLRLIHVEKSNIARRVAEMKKRRHTMKQEPTMARENAPEVDQDDAPTMAQKKGPEVYQHDAPKMKQKSVSAQQKGPHVDANHPNPQQEVSSTNDGLKTPTIPQNHHASPQNIDDDGLKTPTIPQTHHSSPQEIDNDGLKTPNIPQPHHASPQNNDDDVRDSVIIIHLEADLSEKFTTNLSFILSDNPDANDKGAGLLFKASYGKLIQSLRADTFLTADSGDKLWGFVPGGPAPGWWRIRADPSLHACLHAQQACNNNTGRFFYIINHGLFYFCFILLIAQSFPHESGYSFFEIYISNHKSI